MSNPTDVGAPGSRLTPAERRVLEAVCQGRGSKEAAAALGISPRTVEYHLANARSRLNEPTTLGAVVSALRLGIIDPPG